MAKVQMPERKPETAQTLKDVAEKPAAAVISSIQNPPPGNFSHAFERIVIEKPVSGAKGWYLNRKGTFVLEEGPGNILHVTCPHAGVGGMQIWDGIIERDRPVGRIIMDLGPSVPMGVWHANVGFRNGLIVEHKGGHEASPCKATLVWYSAADKGESVFSAKKDAQLGEKTENVWLTHEDCIWYSILITVPRAGSVQVFNGEGRQMFEIPSMFSGSFLVERVFMKSGIEVRCKVSVPMHVTMSWLEKEKK